MGVAVLRCGLASAAPELRALFSGERPETFALGLASAVLLGHG